MDLARGWKMGLVSLVRTLIRRPDVRQDTRHLWQRLQQLGPVDASAHQACRCPGLDNRILQNSQPGLPCSGMDNAQTAVSR